LLQRANSKEEMRELTLIYWIAPYLDEWHVQKQEAGHAAEPGSYEGSFDAKDDAVAWACRVAQRRAPCLVRVQDDDGNITSQFAFEADHEPLLRIGG
jgi:hypothetical protein